MDLGSEGEGERTVSGGGFRTKRGFLRMGFCPFTRDV